MKRNHSIVASTVGSVALVAAFTLSGAGAANATEPDPSSTAAPSQSCWIDATTLQSLCVPTGDDLIAAVQDADGIIIDVPQGASISGNIVTNAQSLSATLSLNAATVIATSIIYDDINYGGGSLIMTAASCGAGIPSLVPDGWNDRASSFKSYNGCLTALYQNINYGGTREGFSSSKSSFGSQNDQGSSWKTE